MALTRAEWDGLWEAGAQLGYCDALGGAEYRRALAEARRAGRVLESPGGAPEAPRGALMRRRGPARAPARSSSWHWLGLALALAALALWPERVLAGLLVCLLVCQATGGGRVWRRWRWVSGQSIGPSGGRR